MTAKEYVVTTVFFSFPSTCYGFYMKNQTFKFFVKNVVKNCVEKFHIKPSLNHLTAQAAGLKKVSRWLISMVDLFKILNTRVLALKVNPMCQGKSFPSSFICGLPLCFIGFIVLSLYGIHSAGSYSPTLLNGDQYGVISIVYSQNFK